MLRCALTGQIPKHPVVSPQGVIFEKEAIQEHLKNSSFCPVKNVPLRFEDLIDIEVTQPTSYPTAIRAASFTDYLNGLTQEWNVVQKELYETRKQLAQCQRELAQALYEKEAAKRVIARLIAEGQATVLSPNIPEEEKFDFNTFIVDSCDERLHKLNFKNRFETSIKPLSQNILSSFENFSVTNTESTTSDDTVFTCFDTNSITKLLIGTTTGKIVVFDMNQKTCIEQLQPGSSQITSVCSFSDNSFLVSDEHTVSIYESYKNPVPKHKVSVVKPIIKAFMHWKKEHIIAVYKDGFGVFTIKGSEEKGASLREDFSIKTADLHIGGRFLATAIEGSNSFLIWDLSTDLEEPIKEFQIEEGDAVVDVKFSPNGINLLVTGEKHCYVYSTENSEEGFTGELSKVETEHGAQTIAWHENGLIFTTISENNMQLCSVVSESGTEVNVVKEFDLNCQPVACTFGGNASFFAAIGPQNTLTVVN